MTPDPVVAIRVPAGWWHLHDVIEHRGQGRYQPEVETPVGR